MRSLFIRVAAALLCLVMALPAFAVDLNGTIKGTVTDDMGLAVPRVPLLLTSPALQGDRETESDDSGRYRFTPLPPGDYILTAKHPNFRIWQSPEIRLHVAETLQIDIEMPEKGSSDEEITVIGEAPAVDVENVGTGVTLGEEFLKNLPNEARDYQSAMSVAPGVVGGGNANMHGSFSSSNQFYMDGVNVTDPVTNTFSMNINYDAIDSIQVITGGMDAEYGRSLGGAVNLVTKSGGNEFSASAHTFYSNQAMILAKELDKGDEFDDTISEQLAFTFGGPIIKDKVWFFTSAQGDRAISRISIDPDAVPRDLKRFPLVPQDWRSLYLFGKITLQPTPRHRIWFDLQTDPTWIDNVEQSPYTLPSAETVQNQGGWIATIGHQFTPTEDLILESQLYFQKSYINYHSILWKNCQEFTPDGQQCAHSFVGMEYLGERVTERWYGLGADDFSSGESPYAYRADRYRMSANSSMTMYGDLLGEHEGKIGFQFENMISDDAFPGASTVGDPYYTTPNDDPNLLGAYRPDQLTIYDDDFEVVLTGQISTLFLQDAYKPHPRLTLRPGIRWDWTMLQAPNGKGDPETVFNTITTAPRMGAAYDLTGKQKTAVHGYYGRFYDSGFLVISDLLRRTASGSRTVGYDDELGDWDYDATQSEVAGAFLVFGPLRNPYSDEFNLGLSQELARRLSIHGTLIYEHAGRFWEDDEVNQIWDDTGQSIIGSRDGTGVDRYRMRTPNGSYTNYASFELVLNKDWSENWTTIGSYTLGRSVGTNSYDQASYALDIPEQREYELGFTDYDIRHNIKLAGSWTWAQVRMGPKTKGGFTLGWNTVAQSGAPYRKLIFNNYYGAVNNWETDGFDVDRLPWYTQVDLRTGAEFEYGDKASWNFGVDWFNLLNTRTATSVRYSGKNYGATVDRQYPRRIQVYAGGEF